MLGKAFGEISRDNYRMVRFFIVGAGGVAVNTFFLWLFTEILGVYYIISSIIAIEIAIMSNFAMNNYWTFDDRNRHNRESLLRRAGKYNIVSYSGDWINVVVIYLLTSIFGIYYLASNIIGIASAVLLKYYMNLNWTWRIKATSSLQR